jgi:hypothetical protein
MVAGRANGFEQQIRGALGGDGVHVTSRELSNGAARPEIVERP